MGRIFLDHWGGKRIFECDKCEAYLSNRAEVMSTTFKGYTGRAFLFHRVANIKEGEAKKREMITGEHIIRDVQCKNCLTKIGWMYEFANDPKERYKEGKIILERKLVREREIFNTQLAEIVSHDASLTCGSNKRLKL